MRKRAANVTTEQAARRSGLRRRPSDAPAPHISRRPQLADPADGVANGVAVPNSWQQHVGSTVLPVLLGQPMESIPLHGDQTSMAEQVVLVQEGAPVRVVVAELPLSPRNLDRLLSRIAGALGSRNSCASFLRGFFAGPPASRDSLAWFLRHWTVLASVRKSCALSTCTRILSRALGFPLAQVEDNLSGFMPAAGGQPPRALAQHLTGERQRCGFVFARSANPCVDGSLVLDGCHAFQARVCPLDQLRDVWRSNASEMLPLFIHEDDVPAVPFETGRYLSRVSGRLSGPTDDSSAGDGPIAPHDLGRPLRLKVDGQWVPCHVRIQALAIEGHIYLCFHMTPL